MKNIKNIIGMLAALVLSGLPYGCSKDYLAPKPLSFSDSPSLPFF